MKSGNPNFLEPSGPLQACNGTARWSGLRPRPSRFTHFVCSVSVHWRILRYLCNKPTNAEWWNMFFDLLFTNMFQSLSRPSPRCHARIQTVAQNVWLKPTDAIVNNNYNYNRNMLVIDNVWWNIKYRCVFVGLVSTVYVKYNNKQCKGKVISLQARCCPEGE